ncbi:MAG: hypothetical protein D3904_12285, partial [Candidatus Electrothrix sp. EH2]|nr:hypothetical protein [Candidatus Electrothrix sp. EH2]
MKTDMTTDPGWCLGPRKRWQITARLKTSTSLHIGSSEYIHHPDVTDKDGKLADINSVVMGKDDLPIIPGSTLKGKLRQWLVEREADPALLESVFGKESPQGGVQGSGGLAEFHDAQIAKRLTGDQPHFPYWREDRQTWVMASTAMNRHTGSALHRHLRYAEAVPPGVVFTIRISGVLDDTEGNLEVDILLAALQGCRAEETAICLGAGDGDGMGRMQLCGAIEARSLDKAAICDWLARMEDAPAEELAMAMDDANCTRLLEEREILDRAAAVLKQGPAPDQDDQDVQLDVTLPFDGPFLVSHPVNKEKSDPDQPDLIPLRDREGKPFLPAPSVRGALRSQAERIVRTLGGHCC